MNCLTLLLLVCVAAQCVSTARIKRDGFDLEEDSSQETKVSGLGDLSGLIMIVKDQFRSIIEESMKQVLEYIKVALQHFKVKLLKKLGKWTFSDLFHSVFDGVTDFVVDASEVTEIPETPASPAQPWPGNPNYPYYPYLWRG